MEHEQDVDEIQKKWHGTLSSYVAGFVISSLLTAASFSLVWMDFISGYGLIFTLIGLGVLQAVAQLLFFLHLGKESSPRWETIVFSFMVLVLVIIVIGTLWIMNDLNNRMMSGMA